MSNVCQAEAARGIARAGVVGVSTDPGVWGVDPQPPEACRRRRNRTILDSIMPLEASNYINFTKKVILRLSIFRECL